MAEPQYIKKTWRIVRTIGEGGMGTVYEVCHKDVPRLRRAVKQLRPEFAARRDILKRFSQEVMLMASLDDADNIVKVLDVDEEEGFGTFIMMQLVDGPSLRQIIDQRGALPHGEVLRLGIEIASALHLAHTNNVIHRDIKAHNILVDAKKGKAFLTDFGIAKELHEDGEETIDATRTEMILGTPRYCSPEQLRNERPPHGRWDVYAFGAVLYEACTGHRFLRQLKSNSEIITQVAFNPNFTPTLDYPHAVPAELRELIAECIERDPLKRLSSAAELVSRLEECRRLYAQRGATPVPVDVELPLPPPDDIDPTQQESYAEPRQALRSEVERRLGVLGQLEEVLVAADLPMGTGPSSETLAGALRDVSISEEAGHFSEALARLEALREKLGEAERTTQRAAGEDFEQIAATLTQRWNDVIERAGAQLSAARQALVEERVAALMQAIGDAQWAAAARRASDTRGAIDGAEDEVRAAAGAAIGALLQDVEAWVTRLRALDRDALPDDAEVAARRGEVAAQLDATQFAAAQRAAEQLHAAVADALAQAEQRAGERVRAMREAAERAAAALDMEAAAALAPEERARATAAHNAAQEAEARGALDEATAAYERAGAEYAAAAQRTAAAQAHEQDALAQELGDLLDASAVEPETIVGAARGAAEALLGNVPARPRDAIAALRASIADLVAARAGVPAFGEAEERRTAAIAEQRRVAELPLPPDAEREARHLMAAAEDLFAARRWSEAGERYTVAREAWTSLEQTSLALAEEERERALQARCVGLQDEISTGLERLERLEAEAAALELPVGAEPVGELRTALADAAELAQGGALEPALERLQGVREATASGTAAYESALGSALAAAANELNAAWDSLAGRAGTLLTADQRREHEQQAADLDRARTAGRWGDARRSDAAARDGLARIADAVRAEASHAVEQELSAMRAGVAELARGGVPQPQVEGGDPDEVAEAVGAAFASGEFAAALHTAKTASQRVAAECVRWREQLSAQVQRARAALDAALRGLDVEAARPVAGEAVEAGERAQATAAQAEQDGDLSAALPEYARALSAYGEARRRLEAEQLLQRAAAQEDLAAVVERAQRAPAELVRPALAAAEAVLGAADAGIGDLRAATAGLAAALAEETVFSAAAERRADAHVADHRAATAGASRRRLKSPRRLLQQAEAAFESRRWSDAAEQYTVAANAFAEVAAAVPVPAGEPAARRGNRLLRYAVPAALVAVVALAVGERAGVIDLFPEAKPAPSARTTEGIESKPAAAAAPHIASFAPSTTDVSLQENHPQRFAIELADVAGAPPEITWSLDGKQVARGPGETAWSYEPDFRSAGGPYEVGVRVADGKAPDQTRSWKVTVADLNRPPTLQAKPAAGVVAAEVGKTATFKVSASDADDDPLTYAWTVDGQPTGGNQAELAVPVSGAQRVAVAVSDGKMTQPARLDWQIKSTLADLVLTPQPSRIASLSFNQSQQFKLTPPASERRTPIQIAWAVDGTKQSDGPTFLFKADDPKLVGAEPVKITASARDDRGRQFDYAWSFAVLPPAPQIDAASPAASGPIDVPPGEPQTFSLTAAPTVGNQHLEYIFTVNGKETRSSSPTYALTPAEGRDYKVVASIEDNYRQRSRERAWSLHATAAVPPPVAKAPVDVSALVRSWLNDYLGALNSKNLATQAALLGLGAEQVRRLEDLQHSRNELSVKFNDIRIEPLGDDRAKVTYRRVDTFKDPNGREQSPSANVEQTFRVVDGRVQLIK